TPAEFEALWLESNRRTIRRPATHSAPTTPQPNPSPRTQVAEPLPNPGSTSRPALGLPGRGQGGRMVTWEYLIVALPAFEPPPRAGSSGRSAGRQKTGRSAPGGTPPSSPSPRSRRRPDRLVRKPSPPRRRL